MDNFKLIEQLVESDIDPNGPAGSILAEKHQNILFAFLRRAGKYTGQPFKAKKTGNIIPSGTLSWNGNSMNEDSEFILKVARKTADGNDISRVLALLNEGAVIHFKDYAGRSCFLKFKSFRSIKDANSNDICEVTVEGFADSLNYTYQDNEIEDCIISFVNKPSAGGSGGGDGVLDPGVHKRYGDYLTLQSDQSNQIDKGVYFALDANRYDSKIQGYAYFEYLGTSNGDSSDYRVISTEEGLTGGGGTGGGAVDSVNGQTGAVEIGADEIPENTSGFVNTDGTNQNEVNEDFDESITVAFEELAEKQYKSPIDGKKYNLKDGGLVEADKPKVLTYSTSIKINNPLGNYYNLVNQATGLTNIIVDTSDMIAGCSSMIRISTDLNGNGDITINNSTNGRKCEPSNWDDSNIMELVIQAISSSEFRWWFNTEKR